MTVSVKGIPIIAKKMQKILPLNVTGTMLPYPIVVQTVDAKKTA
jgi:hypothetical protein